MFADALAAYRARQAELSKEAARATVSAKRGAAELATAAAREQNAGPEAVFHRQERVGVELKSLRKVAVAADKDVATLGKAVHDLEKQALLFGDLEHFLEVIEGEVAEISSTLGRIQTAQQAQQTQQQGVAQQAQRRAGGAGAGARSGS